MRFWILSAILVSVALNVTTAFADTLYGVSSNTPGALYTINPATGTATFQTNISGAAQTSLIGLQFLNGQLYLSDAFSGSTGEFGTVNPATGSFNKISDQGGSINWSALTLTPAGNSFFTVQNDDSQGSHPELIKHLLVVNSTTGVVADVGNTGIQVAGLAYDPSNGKLYAEGSGNLYTLNMTTGASTLVGSFGVSTGFASDLAFRQSTNTLYLNVGDFMASNPNSLYTVNLTTGAATLVGPNGPIGGNGIDGITFAPAAAAAPLPSAAWAGIMLLGVLGLIRCARGWATA